MNAPKPSRRGRLLRRRRDGMGRRGMDERGVELEVDATDDVDADAVTDGVDVAVAAD